MSEQAPEEPPAAAEDDTSVTVELPSDAAVEVAATEDATPEVISETADVQNDNLDEVKQEENSPAETHEETDSTPQPVEPIDDHSEQPIEPDHEDGGSANVEQITETEPPLEADVQKTAVGESEEKTEADNEPNAFGGDIPQSETESTAVEGGNEAPESTTNPENVQGSTENQPQSAEDQPQSAEDPQGTVDQPQSADDQPQSAEDQPQSAEDQSQIEHEVGESADPQISAVTETPPLDADTETPLLEGGDVQPPIKTRDEAVAGAAEPSEIEKDPVLPKSKELTELEKIEQDMIKEAAEEALAAGIAEKMPVVACTIKGPEKLNAESFFKNFRALEEYLKPSETTPSTYVASKKIEQIVTSMSSDMNCLREFCEATQAQMETVREPIKVITDQIFSTIPKAATVEEGELTPAELDADLRQKTAQSQLAKINESLLKSMKLVAQTESAVADAQMAVIEAIELAKKLHAEAEKRLKDEMEAKRLAIEAEKLEIARKKREEEMKIAQALIDAEILKKRAETADKEIKPVMMPIETTYEFDSGIGCVFYSELLSAKMIKCISVDLVEAEFEYIDNEELISHVIRIEPVNELTTIRSALKIAIPHGLTRQQATIREAFIKMQVVHPNGPWKELVTNDVAIEGFTNVKFAEISDVTTFATFAVVSRFKRDVIKMKKRGGTSVSKIDERVEFVYDPGTFNVREKVILQMQPVDSVTIAELRRSLDIAKGLLCSTAVFRTTWRNTNFESPVTVSMILPPNPVAARKLAAERSAKEGKRSKTNIAIGEDGMGDDSGKKKGAGKATDQDAMLLLSLDELALSTAEAADAQAELIPGDEQSNQPGEKEEVVEHIVDGEPLDQETADEKAFAESHKKKKSKKDEESEERKALWQTPVKWYMGKYGKDVEDERDQLFLVRHNAAKGRWTIEPYRIDVGKFDKIFVELQEPIEVFAVFRVSLIVMERDVERIADALEALLTRRLVRFIVKQQFSDPCEVIACIVPILRMERVLKRLQDDEYSDGPEMSNEFLLKDGDCLNLVFRGNIVCEDSAAVLSTIFTTNLDTRFKLRINTNDVYVQKSYDVYRGFVQLRRIFQVLIKPEEPKKKDAKALAAEKAAAALAAKKAAEEAEEMKVNEEASSAEPAVETEGKVDAPATAAEDVKTKPVTDGESKGEGNKAIAATDVLIVEVEEPPVPLYETKEEVLTESLITFPKDSIALTSSVPKKAPITYIPLKDAITHEILKKLSDAVIHENDWRTIIDELNVKSNIQTVIRRRGEQKNLKQNQVRYETLLQWVKTLEKGANKWEQLNNALIASQSLEIAKLLSNMIAGKQELVRFSKSQDELEEEELKQQQLKQAQLEEEAKMEESANSGKFHLKMKKAMVKSHEDKS